MTTTAHVRTTEPSGKVKRIRRHPDVAIAPGRGPGSGRPAVDLERRSR